MDCLNLLGVSLHGQGRYLEAIEVYRTALAQIRSENGNIQYRRAKILSNLASSLISVRQSKEATALCEESLAIFKNENSAETERSVVLNTYGEALAQEARLNDAEARSAVPSKSGNSLEQNSMRI
ncbi:MAG: tetratricopeptide repeat protein [Candidatus Obscuribacterales bacterium]|nr:tetratricopeptide repeat protein [Candidatus Obscuribacterales bacterium]